MALYCHHINFKSKGFIATLFSMLSALARNSLSDNCKKCRLSVLSETRLKSKLFTWQLSTAMHAFITTKWLRFAHDLWYIVLIHFDWSVYTKSFFLASTVHLCHQMPGNHNTEHYVCYLASAWYRYTDVVSRTVEEKTSVYSLIRLR